MAVIASLALDGCADSSPTGSGAVFTTIDELQAIDVDAQINPYNAKANEFGGYNKMQLAWGKNSLSNPNHLYPGLAAKWSLSADGSALAAHLQPDAKWSDGTPVTSKDVKTSVALGISQGNNPVSIGIVNSGAHPGDPAPHRRHRHSATARQPPADADDHRSYRLRIALPLCTQSSIWHDVRERIRSSRPHRATTGWSAATRSTLATRSRQRANCERIGGAHMIEATGLVKNYRARRGSLGSTVRALRGADVSIPDGGAVSIIGESGCGNTTLGRILAGVESADGGEISVNGVGLSSLRRKQRRIALQRVQLIHQDPYSALNPTRTVEAILTDALRLRAKQTKRDERWIREPMHELLTMVGLDAEFTLPRYPHQLSGGMRQRVVIARALSVDPHVLVADEAVSMLDVSLRLGILALLRRLRAELGVSELFVTHDVATARYIGEDSQIYMLYRGTVVEQGPADDVIMRPVHPYTQSLLSAIPILKGLEAEPVVRIVPIAPLDESQSDTGCLFAARCPVAHTECESTTPPLVPLERVSPDSGSPGGEHRNACLFPEVRAVVALESGSAPV